jgi:polyisoprenoid-binding protein YceI
MNYLKKSLIAGVLTAALSQNAISSELTSPGKYIIDQQHSGITFEVNHLGYTDVVGRFNNISGDFNISTDQSSLNIAIQSASIDTNHDKRDDHLRSPDFFNAKQFPVISFSSSLEIEDSNGQSFIEGTLELLGVSKPIKLNIKKGKEGKDPWGLYRTGYSATGVIKRSEYGMNFMQGGLGDDIHIKMNIEAVKQ